MKKLTTRLIIISLCLNLSNYILSQTVSTQKAIYAPNEAIVVNYSGFPGNMKDYIDIAPASYPDGQGQGYWKYTDGNKSGTLTFSGMPYGTYEVRGYFNNGSVVSARYRFTVGNADPNALPQVISQKNPYPPGEQIIVNYSGFPGNQKDWIGLVPASYPDEQGSQWFFTEGKQSGTMTFNGLPNGEYEVRGFFNNEYAVRARYRFTVGNADPNAQPQVRTQKNVYAANEGIAADFSGFPGNQKDWIGIAPASYKDDQLSQWFFTDGKQSGTINFTGLPEGSYEVRGYFNNEYTVRARYAFTVSKGGVVISGGPRKICRRELSVFYAGMGGLGSAWGRTTLEPTIMTPKGVSDMQGVMGNARDALIMLGNCIPFDINKLNSLIARLSTLTNVQAEAEIRGLILELQAAIARSPATCDQGITLSSLFVTGVHVGAAQAHASGRMCQPAPMPAAFQTVIRNHLNTARDAFAGFLGCAPGFSLSQFDNVPLNSINSTEAHTNIMGLHTSILWNIALSDCCCNCP